MEAKQNRIPSKVALIKRGAHVNAITCDVCQVIDETTDHLLIECSVAKEVWSKVEQWCGIANSILECTTVKEVLAKDRRWGNCPKEKKVAEAIKYGTIWCLWKARNERVFRNIRSQPAKIVDNIKSVLFAWIKHRIKKGVLDWNLWCNNPLKCG